MITNLKTRYEHLANGAWSAFGAWDEVVTTKGEPFLQYHFDGDGQKVRDLRGVRPEGVERARKAAKAWMLDLIRRKKGAA